VLVVSPAYFRTLGTAVLAGRPFDESDNSKAEQVAIVNATFARRFYPGGDAIGRRIQWGATQAYISIIGMTADIGRLEES
jgi:putative ABC transport system permease protein